ncbi:MAG: hypothetical protein ACC630_00235 [Nitrospinota bacterium]
MRLTFPELISLGKTARTEIESILEIHAGAYLARLEDDYSLFGCYILSAQSLIW